MCCMPIKSSALDIEYVAAVSHPSSLPTSFARVFLFDSWRKQAAYYGPFMSKEHKAVRIDLADLHSAPMRAFHLTWFAFFLCFFGWFGIAPLMPIVRDELHLTKQQIGNTVIASVAITVLARLLIGWICDRFGPRRTYAWLLILGAIPVMGVALVHSYQGLLAARLAIGVIGASFVITQYHTSLMFAPNCIGTANATTAGWGNLGGGVTQMVMPLLLAGVLALGVGPHVAWRLTMVVPGIALLLTGIAYYRFTQDTPDGNFGARRTPAHTASGRPGGFRAALRDYRVWALFLAYAACFGVELTIDNIAALYFHDSFHLGVAAAGFLAGLFGFMNIFARTLGGYVSDRLAVGGGLRGRALLLGAILVAEGCALMVFADTHWLAPAVCIFLVFGLLVEAACGATYAVVPMFGSKSLGSISGIVGAGGNVGAVAAGLLFRSASLDMSTALLLMGLAVVVSSLGVFAVRFSPAEERAAEAELHASLARRNELAAATLDPA